MTAAPHPEQDEYAALRAILVGTARHTGEEFFGSLVRNLSAVTGVPSAFVAEFAGSVTRVRTIAYWTDGAFAENVEWSLAGTPCEDVVKGNLCHHPTGVTEKFPEDKGLAGTESYLGVPLRGAVGEVLGHLAVYDSKPMPPQPRLLYTFQIFAARAAAELDRLRLDRQLQDRERRYRDLYDEAPSAYVSLTPDGRLAETNRFLGRLLGCGAEDLLGRPFLDLFADTPAGKGRMADALDRLGHEGYVSIDEVEMRARDGRAVWGHAQVRGGRVILSDVSARVVAERERVRLAQQNQYLQEEIKAAHNYEEIVGQSPGLLSVLQQVSKVAATDTTVLILGETGTGKELVARAVHSASPRKGKPLIKVNCAALPAGLVESELFGHEKGAFTGAVARRLGRFELADGGTLFLDEVGELPPDAQAKLLRVLQEQEFERVGGTAPVRVDIRVIAATSRDLAALVRAKAFREDLFYRLHVFPVQLPPLRDRRDDIPLLVHFFVTKFAARIGKRVERVGQDTLDLLTAYRWPGNIRELQNVLERAIILSDGPAIEIDPEVLAIAPELPDAGSSETAGRSLRAVERDYILTALQQAGWVIEGPTGAAQLLGLHPNTLRSRLKKYGIARPDPEGH